MQQYDEKMQNMINQPCHQVKLINMNILQTNKYYLPIKVKYKGKLSFTT